ncbi:MAG TPA: 2-amino-4-hydroxy-6-hydroxymethyldihydropteridine diphosphokinase [Bacteroidia bacterium]|nr:2-amino-4-hydroxy-6-hydroxymethyldihydropteridine diphosphokinase [Bacteroidia bacterium]HNU34198.1 2-amino-4-hydroxy-6-hydroxymethyldihydropteridine diphosphokinase [Bacteroidia bacterium]
MSLQKVILLLGSNMGERKYQIVKALELLEREVGEIILQSGLYETEAWGKTDQPPFLNLCVVIETKFSPKDVLAKNLLIEADMGRVRGDKWGARVIDIDILFYGNEIVEERNLRIPHPEFENRKFAIVPLMEIQPAFIHPVSSKTIQEVYANCNDSLKVRLIKPEL